MARIERTEGREETRNGVSANPLVPSLTQKGAPKSAPKGAKKRPHSKLKNYLLHYAKGKYYLINLKLKKKGHDQKYL
jgi:hypothetical protein